MGTDERLLSLPFDHYERYSITAEILSILEEDLDQPLRILDVGGHSSSLKLFRPSDQIVLSDKKEPPTFTHVQELPFLYDHYVVSVGGQLPFSEAAFDVVTAHDTLEHVPAPGRAAFLEDLFRLSSRFVVLHGPLAHPQVDRAERRLAQFWQTALGWDDHPLDEHLAHGLPEREQIERALEDASMPYIALPNGNVQVWLAMMAIEGYVQSLPKSTKLLSTLERVFNRAIAPGDFGGVCYRTAFVAARRPEDGEALLRVERAFESRMMRSPAHDDLSFLEQILSGLEDHAVSNRGFIDSLTSEAERAETERLEGEAWVRATADVLARNEGRLARAESELRTTTSELAESATRTEALAQELGVVRAELDRTQSSAAYRIARRIRRWFPSGTIRGWLLSRVGRLARRRLDRRRQRMFVESAGESESPIISGSAGSTPPVYQRWIDRHEPATEELEKQRLSVASLPYRPRISIIVPTWNPLPRYLNHMLESVLAQTYDGWELCVADGASDMEAKRLLSKFRDRDERIRVSFLDENLGISGNTSEALRLATGEYVAFLDQSDVLAPFALAQVTEALNRDPGLDVLYSDWDLISDDGHARFNPFFTPTWSPELLLSTNYMTHLSVVRRSLIDEVGGPRSEVDGAQDWDLLLRVSERTDRIARIPKVLYHWRADPASAALTLEAKPAAEAAQRRVVEEHLERTKALGTVSRAGSGQLRVRWQIRGEPKVSIIIPTRHNRELLERCLAGIARSSYSNHEVLVVETAGRTDEREEWYRQLTDLFPVRVLWWEEPFNYSAVNNLAARETNGDILLFLNDDTEPLDPDWLGELVGWVQQDDIGVVGAQLLADDGSIQHGGVIVGLGGFAEHLFRGMVPGGWTIFGSADWYRNVSAVTGACLAIQRDTLDRLGGWDERFELCGSDVELCLRARREGLRVVVTPFAHVRHIEKVTRGKTVPEMDYCVSFWHYQQLLYGGDPYFNPNLSLEHSIPQLASAARPESLTIVSQHVGRDIHPRMPGDDQRGVEALVEASRATPGDLDVIGRAHRRTSGRQEIGSVNWFIPDFENPFYGGIHTIFRFADHFQREYGVKNRFVVIGTGPEAYIRSGLRVSFPELADSDIVIAPGGQDDRLADVPSSDVGIATLWVTAYPMARWHGADRFFYFVQDFEPMFYPAGTLYALTEETYRIGLYGLANTPPLKDMYESYGSPAISFTPCVDADIFHAERLSRGPDEPYTVFMYARPGHPRNCYELAIAALGRLKERMADRVRIVTAGSWTTVDEEVPWLDRLGLLDYRETADLYRRCDAGLVLSVSKHPTYIPLQLMGCGALVVANDNPANGWLLRDGENCILADPTADALAASLERGLLEDDLRAALTARAAADVRERHADWGGEIERVYRFMRDPDGT